MDLHRLRQGRFQRYESRASLQAISTKLRQLIAALRHGALKASGLAPKE